MNSSDLPASTHYAEADTAERYDLKRRILACLRGRIPSLPGLHITVVGNTAVLRGNVRTLQEKSLCLECCRHVPGVVMVVDDLTVAELTSVYFDPENGLL